VDLYGNVNSQQNKGSIRKRGLSYKKEHHGIDHKKETEQDILQRKIDSITRSCM